MKAPAEAAGEGEASDLIERLERLQAQLLELNAVLQEMVASGGTLRRRRTRRKVSAAAELARFRKQARKLTQYAPS